MTSLFCCMLLAATASPTLAVQELRCEYRIDPVGIDAEQPRLTWQLVSGRRGVEQTAYQVFVASSPELLDDGRADLWDSGWVDSRQSVHVAYAGTPLRSSLQCWWKVRVRDNHGEESEWSPVAQWTMGILQDSDWQAAWITSPPTPEPSAALPALGVEDGAWIWFPEGQPAKGATSGRVFFKKVVTVDEPSGLAAARCAMSADNQFVLYVNGHKIGEGNRWRYPRCFDVLRYLRQGENVIAVEAENRGGGAGLIGVVELRREDGFVERLGTDADWRVTREPAEDWRTSADADDGWQESMVLGETAEERWGFPDAYPTQPTWEEAAPLFRRDFQVREGLQRAVLHAAGLGYQELFLNGSRVGDHELDPAFTRYDKRVLYATHDVTGLLTPGKNALGAMLGNGWYNMHAKAEWDFNVAPWRDRPKLLAQLHLFYEDGSEETVVSDAQWRTAPGPITFDCIRNGEFYDARREQPGWSTPDFDGDAWAGVETIAGPAGRLVAQGMPPVRVVKTLRPVTITEPAPGVYLVDMGQNFSGWARLRVEGPAGTEVVLRYDERVTDTGFLDQANSVYVHSGDFQTDRYTLKGDGEEVWEPSFTYHGFQYIQVEGYPGTLTEDDIEGRVVHTDFEQRSSFTCSNELLNAIQRNARWAYVSNFVGYPTDCPHREKNGWTGDAHLAAEQAFYNFRPAAAYAKWVSDIEDEAGEDGAFSGIIPSSGWGYNIGPAWDCAYVLIPWYQYLYRGDERILEDHYEGIKRYQRFLASKAEGHIVSYGLGDWVPAKTRTPSVITSTAYYYVDTLLLARMARILGNDEDAKAFQTEAEAIKTAFNERFAQEDGTYDGGTQTAQSTALYQGLVPEGREADVLAVLVRALADEEYHFDGGILGAKYVLHALSGEGRPDLAYRIATNTDFPSWGYWIEQGANTLWENWDGTLSRNHIMYGDICAWMYRTLAGIQPDPEAPGFKHIVLRPEPVEGLDWVRADCDTPYGFVRSHWEKEDGRFTYQVELPANTTATIHLPASSAAEVTENGKPLGEAEGVTVRGQRDGRLVTEVGSGAYEFVCGM